MNGTRLLRRVLLVALVVQPLTAARADGVDRLAAVLDPIAGYPVSVILRNGMHESEFGWYGRFTVSEMASIVDPQGPALDEKELTRLARGLAETMFRTLDMPETARVVLRETRKLETASIPPGTRQVGRIFMFEITIAGLVIRQSRISVLLLFDGSVTSIGLEIPEIPAEMLEALSAPRMQKAEAWERMRKSLRENLMLAASYVLSTDGRALVPVVTEPTLALGLIGARSPFKQGPGWLYWRAHSDNALLLVDAFTGEIVRFDTDPGMIEE